MTDPLDLEAVRRRCHLARASGTVSLDIPHVLALCDEVERLRGREVAWREMEQQYADALNQLQDYS